MLPLVGFILIAAFGLAGIPPLSGFVGKLLIVQGAFEAGNVFGSIVILASSLLYCCPLFEFLSMHSGASPLHGELPKTNSRSYRKMMAPAIVLVILSVLYGVGTEWLIPYMTDATDVLLQPSIYIDAVLKE